MVVGEDRDMQCRCCIRNREGFIEENVAVNEGICQNDRICMDWTDDVGPRSEILSKQRLRGTSCQHRRQDEFEDHSHPSLSLKIGRGQSPNVFFVLCCAVQSSLISTNSAAPSRVNRASSAPHVPAHRPVWHKALPEPWAMRPLTPKCQESAYRRRSCRCPESRASCSGRPRTS